MRGYCTCVTLLQTQTGRGGGVGGDDPSALGAAEEGGSGAGRHMSHLPQDQVRGRCGPHV